MRVHVDAGFDVENNRSLHVDAPVDSVADRLVAKRELTVDATRLRASLPSGSNRPTVRRRSDGKGKLIVVIASGRQSSDLMQGGPHNWLMGTGRAEMGESDR
jgi:hypothetical protein